MISRIHVYYYYLTVGTAHVESSAAPLDDTQGQGDESTPKTSEEQSVEQHPSVVNEVWCHRPTHVPIVVTHDIYHYICTLGGWRGRKHTR